MWWLGDQEVPGAQDWMKKRIEAYQSRYPNVTIKPVVQNTANWTQTQSIACKGKSGPDLWYNWGGTWSLEQAWRGCTVPNEDVLAPADIEPVERVSEQSWKGKTWMYPLYRFVYPLVYNKGLFERAGLDPESPPKTWDEFTAAADKLKAKGIDPMVIGLKDGFGGEILGAATFQKQVVPSMSELIQMTVDGDFTGDLWRSWIERAAELKQYVNDDSNSMVFGEGLNAFKAGKAAMVAGTPGVQAMIEAMQKAGDEVGVMKPPVFGDGPFADSLAQLGSGFQVTSWSEQPKVAGHFLAFLHEKESLDSFYADTGNFPADARWDASAVESETDRQMLDWMEEKTAGFPAVYYPTDLDVNGNFVVFQGLLGGDMTVDEAAKTYEDVITKWRKLHKGEIANFESWAKDPSNK
jgi:multiple sugar transport system substrate-binding protein